MRPTFFSKKNRRVDELKESPSRPRSFAYYPPFRIIEFVDSYAKQRRGMEDGGWRFVLTEFSYRVSLCVSLRSLFMAPQ